VAALWQFVAVGVDVSFSVPLRLLRNGIEQEESFRQRVDRDKTLPTHAQQNESAEASSLDVIR
jgi:hypothetical protein